MTLIIGILVDDSIVVLENVERHFDDGEAPRTAAILGRSEIGRPPIVITLVDVVVFLPIAFLPGITGRFLSEFGIGRRHRDADLAGRLVHDHAVAGRAIGRCSRSGSAPRFIDAFARGFERLRVVVHRARRCRCAALPDRDRRRAASLLTAGAIALIPLGVIGFEFIPRPRSRPDLRAGEVPDRDAADDDRCGGAQLDRAASCSCPTCSASPRCPVPCSGLRRRGEPGLERSDHGVPQAQPHALDRRPGPHDDAVGPGASCPARA